MVLPKCVCESCGAVTDIEREQGDCRYWSRRVNRVTACERCSFDGQLYYESEMWPHVPILFVKKTFEVDDESEG